MSVGLVPSMYLYLAEGTFIAATNTILLLSILGKKKNRERREFLLIAVQALADTFYALSFMLMARYRLGLVAQGRVESNSTVWQCAQLAALPIHNWATPLLGLLPLTTSLNFLACSKAPLWYHLQGKTYTVAIIGAPHLVSLTLSMVNYVLLWGDPTPMPALCVAAKGAAHPLTYGCMLALRVLAHFASAVIYAVLLVYLKKSHSSRINEEMTAQQRKNHRNATVTLGCVTLNSFILLLIPDLLLFFNPRNISKDYSTLLYSMTLSKTTINFFIYMWRYNELRGMVITMTCRRVPRLRRYFPDATSSVAPFSRHVNSSGGTKLEGQSKFLDAAKRTSTVLAVTQRKRPSIHFETTDGITGDKAKEPIMEEEEPVTEEVHSTEEKEKKEAVNYSEETKEIKKNPMETARSGNLLDISRFWYNI